MAETVHTLSNDELAAAIDYARGAAASTGSECDYMPGARSRGDGDVERLFRDHLRALLAVQLGRADPILRTPMLAADLATIHESPIVAALRERRQ